MIKNLKLNLELKKYGINFTFLFVEKILRILLSILVISRVSKFLEPSNYGILSLLESIFSILFSIAALGIDPIIIKYFKLDKIENKKIFTTSFYIKLFASILVVFIYVIITFFVTSIKTVSFYHLIVGFSIIFSPFNVIDYYLQAEVNSKATSTIRSAAFVFVSLMKLYFVYSSLSLIYFILTILIENLFVAIGYIGVTFRREFSFNIKYFSKELAKELLNPAIKLIFIALSLMIYTRIDQLMIKNILGDFMLGNYSAAQKIVETSYILPTIIISSIYPKTIEKLNHKNFSYIKKSFKYIYFISTLIAIVIFFSSDIVTNLIFGEKYIYTSELIKILCFSIIFYSIKMFFNQITYVRNLEKSLLIQTLSAIILNIILNYILINLFGVVGAAYATIIALIFSTYIYDLFDKNFKKYLKLKLPF